MVAEHGSIVELRQGQPLFHQGDEATSFYLLLQGQVKLFRLSPAGDEKVVEVVSPGTLFAEALMFSEAPNYPVSSQALKKSELLRIDSAHYLSLLNQSVDLCLAMLSDMSVRLHGLLREVDDLSLHTAIGRLAGHLLRSAPADNSEFQLSMPKQTLASRLSIKPETFSRILKQLASKGLIEIHDSRIRILDREALSEIADTCAL